MSEKTIEAFASIKRVPLLTKGEEHPELAEVQSFLQRFGYLAPQAYKDSQVDDATEEALARYQQRHGLVPSGAFDEETKAQMTTHRCGLPDLSDGVEFAVSCSWPNPTLTFAFEDGTNDVGGSTELQAVRDACATWVAAAPITLTEVAMDQHPDIVVDWRPATDPDHSMVGGVLAHADFPPGCSVVTNTLPKPLHFDDSEHQWVIGSVAGGFDVETVALHELGHLLGLKHSDVPGSVMFPSVSDNATNRVLTADDLGGIGKLYPASHLTPGTYTIAQKSSGRFLDAHEIEANDFRLVTRTAQNNDSQRWELVKVGVVYTIRQKSSGRYLDAHDSGANDFRLVTRPAQGDDSQRWVVVPAGDGSFTIQQLSNARFADAHEVADKDFALVTRPAQDNATQRWLLGAAGQNTFTIRQKSNGRFVDAHETSAKDFSVVTRPDQGNDTQRWVFGQVGAVYTIRQKSNGRFVDAHETSAKDFAAVTRPAQNNNTQRWVLRPAGAGSFTIQQLSNARKLDAHSVGDFTVVTRPNQGDDSQRWLFTPA